MDKLLKDLLNRRKKSNIKWEKKKLEDLFWFYNR